MPDFLRGGKAGHGDAPFASRLLSVARSKLWRGTSQTGKVIAETRPWHLVGNASPLRSGMLRLYGAGTAGLPVADPRGPRVPLLFQQWRGRLAPVDAAAPS